MNSAALHYLSLLLDIYIVFNSLFTRPSLLSVKPIGMNVRAKPELQSLSDQLTITLSTGRTETIEQGAD